MIRRDGGRTNSGVQESSMTRMNVRALFSNVTTIDPKLVTSVPKRAMCLQTVDYMLLIVA